jgi:hypothetical protein
MRCIRLESFGEFCDTSVQSHKGVRGIRTPHLLKALTMQLANRIVLLFQLLQTARQRIGNLSAVDRVVVGIGFVVLERYLHLLYRLDQATGLLRHLVLLVCHLP